jgi:hypothetical protein
MCVDHQLSEAVKRDHIRGFQVNSSKLGVLVYRYSMYMSFAVVCGMAKYKVIVRDCIYFRSSASDTVFLGKRSCKSISCCLNIQPPYLDLALLRMAARILCLFVTSIISFTFNSLPAFHIETIYSEPRLTFSLLV